tara:strand:+ start:17 stop:763 length:747 start_codon:yes stop_codon:yes gene_type:complete
VIQLYNNDCFDVFSKIEDNSIDLILTDPPYGTTACKWDSIIPFDPMWKELKRIIRDSGCIALFGTEPFSSKLRLSNLNWFKYDWIWEKNKIHGLFKNQPRRSFEIISIFYKKPPIWNEIKIKRTEKEYKLCKRTKNSKTIGSVHRPNQEFILIRKSLEDQWYKKPINILQFNKDDIRNGKQHPTQKPLALLEYLIKTYTNENNIVLDFTMGSGSTGVACKNSNRKFIGIEKDKEYFEIAKTRIHNALI